MPLMVCRKVWPDSVPKPRHSAPFLSEVTVRIARRGDLPEASRLLHKEIYEEQTLETIRSWIIHYGWPTSRYMLWYCAELKGKIVGVMSWEIWDRYGRDVILLSSWLAVSSSVHRRGIGTKLWMDSKAMLGKALAKRGQRVRLIFTTTDLDRKSACRFYEKTFGSLGNVRRMAFRDVWTQTSTGEGGVAFYFVKTPRQD